MGDVRKKIHIGPKLISNTAAGIWSSASPPPWIDLPIDLTANILHRLGAIEILESAQFVCSTWWRVCKDPSMWRVVDMNNSGDGDLKKLESMCLHAVDRSQGELIDINIEYFCTKEILSYIFNRSPHLKNLRIACWDDYCDNDLVSAVKKLPELEELHLFYTPSIYAEDIESIGISCPMLKSFTYNSRCYRYVEIDDSYALVIAKNMPNLRQLRLFGNKLSDRGLQAILDGCCLLELVDIRQCYMVGLLGDLDKRCSELIKDLRRPSDSTADYEWDDEVFEFEVEWVEYDYEDGDEGEGEGGDEGGDEDEDEDEGDYDYDKGDYDYDKGDEIMKVMEMKKIYDQIMHD